MSTIQIDRYSLEIERTCHECGSKYCLTDMIDAHEADFLKPLRYIDGCEQYCLACWLGVGPKDFVAEGDSRTPVSQDLISALHVEVPYQELRDGSFHVKWPKDAVEGLLLEGNLAEAYRWFFDEGWHLAVLPISRVKIVNPVFFPNGGAIYPQQVVQLSPLHVTANRLDERTSGSAEACSAASGIDATTFERNPVIVLPCRFDWSRFIEGHHEDHLEFIRTISGLVDLTFWNFMRYWKCRLHSTGTLPGRAGQTRDNARMAGALVFNHSLNESRIVGGAVFAHTITDGLGMGVTQPEWDRMPQSGEVGRIVYHGLFLYANMLEAPTLTAKFMQAIAALEYLAFPFDFLALKKVRVVVVKYAARSVSEHHQLTDRFKQQLFGENGLRTQIVHNGKLLEQLVQGELERRLLLQEMDRYIRAMIDHMIPLSEMSWREYLALRQQLGAIKSQEED